jgi:hypothetical protein
VKNVGWDKLDSTACHEALQGIRDVELHNLYHWGAAQGTRYTNKYQIFKFVNGKHELASDKWWSAPDVRPAKFRTAEYNWSGAGWPAGYFKQ